MPGRAARRLACLIGALIALAPTTALAADGQSRIINGTPAAPAEYEAQGYLRLTVSGSTYSCGGTLISARHFLTAAHCATDPSSGAPLAPSAFTVRLGSNSRDSGGSVYAIARNHVHESYNGATLDNDVALLTLAGPAPSELAPLRLIRTDEPQRWAPEVIATVIGWGKTANTPENSGSDELREAEVPIRTDADCSGLTAYGSDFHPTTMVCAGNGTADTCAGDSGGPLMVSDGAAFALAGITSWGDVVCNHPTRPGVYTRLGAPHLNAWVRAGRAELDFTTSPAAPVAGQPVTLTAASQGAGDYLWDLDNDGQYDDGAGPQAGRTFTGPGRFTVGLRANDADAQNAERRRAVTIAPVPGPTATPTPGPTASPTPAPPATTQPIPLPREPLATILVSGRPRVRSGRFNIRVAFARTAPSGTAVIEVFNGRRVVGLVRTTVRRGASKRVSLRLTPAGRRLLRRSAAGRLEVRVRVRVRSRALRSKVITIRR